MYIRGAAKIPNSHILNILSLKHRKYFCCTLFIYIYIYMCVCMCVCVYVCVSDI